jgi:hydrolase, TatD family
MAYRRKGKEMIFDTHAHYDDKQFQEDRSKLMEQMRENGIDTIINVSARVDSWAATIQLTQEYDFVYGAIGVHPDEVGNLTEAKFEEMKAFFENKKVVAVGEIGLDYYWDTNSHEVQEKWFVKQLELAKSKNLPVNIHSRDAAQDTMRILKQHGESLSGIIHCYSYSKEVAKEYVDMGYYLGIGGVITFQNAKKLKEVVKETPLENLVLETDCPYLAPAPNRGKRNTSLNLKYVAGEIANIKSISPEEVIEQTAQNARKVYRL